MSTPYRVRALYAYQARGPNELSIQVGEEVTVVKTDEKGLWWQGDNGIKKGWFPASYVQRIDDDYNNDNGYHSTSRPPASLPSVVSRPTPTKNNSLAKTSPKFKPQNPNSTSSQTPQPQRSSSFRSGPKRQLSDGNVSSRSAVESRPSPTPKKSSPSPQSFSTAPASEPQSVPNLSPSSNYPTSSFTTLRRPPPQQPPPPPPPMKKHQQQHSSPQPKSSLNSSTPSRPTPKQAPSTPLPPLKITSTSTSPSTGSSLYPSPKSAPSPSVRPSLQQPANSYTSNESNDISRTSSKTSTTKRVSKRDPNRMSYNVAGTLELPPKPRVPPSIDKGKSLTYLRLQIVNGKGFDGKVEPYVQILLKNIVSEKESKIFSTTKAKGPNPIWNEAFKINVRDAETEVLILRVGSKKDPAELKFPLRSSERNYDHPNFLYKWHTLQSASGQQLQLQVYIQYVDRRQYSAPTDFKHNMHVGWTPSGGFDVRNIPKEWMTLFQKAGITKDELSNPETAAMLYNKIKQYEQENHIQFAANAPPPPPPPPPPSSNKGGTTSPPSRPRQTPAVNMTTNTDENGYTNNEEYNTDITTTEDNTPYDGYDADTTATTAEESTEPEPSSFLDQIRKGTQLRPVSPPNSGGGGNSATLEQHTNSLAALLAQAMDLRRNAIAAIEEEAEDRVDEEDDWSDWDDEGSYAP